MNTWLEQQNFLEHTLLELCEAKTMERADWELKEPLVLRHHALLTFAKGKGILIINGTPIKITRKSVFLLLPGTNVESNLADKEDVEAHWVSFDLFRQVEATEQRRVYEREQSFPVQGLIANSYTRLQRMIAAIVSGQTNAAKNNRMRQMENLHALLEKVVTDHLPRRHEGEEHWLQQTVSYILQNYQQEIKVESLAEMAGMHPAYYSQLFKREMKKTPIEYLTQLRMNKAKELLLTAAPDKNIREIASSVGYLDEFYFSRRFKENSGYSPSTYKKSRHEPCVISLSFPYTEHLLALGLTPCAAQTHPHLSIDTVSLPLPYHASEMWEISRQSFVESKPDLIICKDHVQTKAREHLGDIAPIFSISWKETDMFGHLMEIAHLVDRKREARTWLDRHTKKTEFMRKKVKALLGEATVAICVVRDQAYRMYSTRNIGHVFYRSLELGVPEKIQRELDPYPPGTQFNWVGMPKEELPQYEADYLFFVVRSEDEVKMVEYDIQTLESWKKHSAIAAGRYVFLDWYKWMVYAPLSIEKQLEESYDLFASLMDKSFSIKNPSKNA
ncbi:helix-turn-helix domain-containing protein [Brevibacillus porteri]|uniref:helix-turn-helix domain-containing protein n=1 Tax=Brevibacillus porteri TaxID=2126350 RepID=UPI00370B9895